MEKVSLKEKHKWINEMNMMIWSNNTIDANAKNALYREIMNVIGMDMTTEQLEIKKIQILESIKNSRKDTMNKVTNDLKNPVNLNNVSDIKDIDTLNRPNGQVITSVQKNDGSIYVKDSSYSGDIDKVVSEVANNAKNKNLTREELTSEAFKEMDRRQIPINMSNINNLNINSSQAQNYTNMAKDNNVMINKEYGVMVDSSNNIYDLRNQNNQSMSYDNNQNVLDKPKVKTYARNNKQVNDAAFVDAALVGMVTFYAGILGLCSIFSQM